MEHFLIWYGRLCIWRNNVCCDFFVVYLMSCGWVVQSATPYTQFRSLVSSILVILGGRLLLKLVFITEFWSVRELWGVCLFHKGMIKFVRCHMWSNFFCCKLVRVETIFWSRWCNCENYDHPWWDISTQIWDCIEDWSYWSHLATLLNAEGRMNIHAFSFAWRLKPWYATMTSLKSVTKYC